MSGKPDPAMLDYLARSAYQIEQSRFFLALVAGRFDEDPGCMMQLGLALTMNKPIVLVVEKGYAISPRLKRVADYIGYYKPGDNADLRRVTEELTRKVKR